MPDFFQPWAEAYEKLAALGLPVFLFIAGVGHYYGVWEWGKTARANLEKVEARELATLAKKDKELEDIKASYAKREAHLESRNDWLFERVVETTGVVEKTARQVTRRGPQAA